MNIELAFFFSFALIVIGTVLGLKFLKRVTGTTHLFADGAVIKEDGIEFLRFLFVKRKVAFNDVESVEVVSWAKAVASIMCFHYGKPVLEIRTRLFSDYVRVKLKPRPKRWYVYYFEYLLFTPENPSKFVERLNSRITQHSNSD
jgi:hypothetical protein